MKYAHIDADSTLQGFYDDNEHESIPTPNVQITEDQWKHILKNGHNKVYSDGTSEFVDHRPDEEKAKDYMFDRRNAYPSIGDQLDALFKAGIFPDDMAAQIQVVKDKYPKPE